LFGNVFTITNRLKVVCLYLVQLLKIPNGYVAHRAYFKCVPFTLFLKSKGTHELRDKGGGKAPHGFANKIVI